MTKLSDRKIRFICNHVVNTGDWTIQSCSIQYKVSIRRIQQLVKEYRESGEYPKLKKNRRPTAPPLTSQEKKQIDLVWKEYRFCARMIYNHLRAQKIRIHHHKIHEYMKVTRDLRQIQINRRRGKDVGMKEIIPSVWYTVTGIEPR